MLKSLLAASLAALCLATPVFAQDDYEEIVVTGTRLARYEDYQVPQIFMKRRADFAIISLEVRSDTRDFSQRREEIRSALRGLQARTRDGAVTMALVDDEVGIVRDFTMAAAEELIRVDRRPDTSLITIRLRTPIRASDTLESINQRVESFVEQAPKPGRVEMETGETQLTLVNPQQYRDPLLSQITADGRRITEMLGQGYAIELSGLERQVAWQRSGELELTLFLPYSLSVAPQP
jgi:hypothetical protein